MKRLLLIPVIIFCACNTTQKITATKITLPQNVSLNGKLFSSLYMQRSAEYRALCLQAYNIAKFRIQNYKPITKKPKAIITDIDETILDNSPYAVHQAYKGQEYESTSWYEWTGMSAADTMPGAASLLKFAASQNVEIFYVSNREEKERTGTLNNLKRFGLPNTDDAHFFPKINMSSKEERRLNIMQTHEVILLMGDNLADFSKLFDRKSEAERKTNTDISAADFGKRFIIFPNPNYGDWESSLYLYNYKLTQGQKDSVIKTALKDY
ncbi:MAG: 5'-nucleotidase, lipoprotein e(P4) family [Bacteroidota bacterium]